MKLRSNVWRNYLAEAPIPLAFERAIEARLYEGRRFEKPILDIGCGEGIFARMVFAEKIDTGIDPDPRELERARELGGYDELIQCFGDAVPKPDASYRTVFSNSVMEHIPDVGPVFQEAFRLLAPGGEFYFCVPSDKFDRYSVVNIVLEKAGLQGLALRYRLFFNRFWRHFHAYTVDHWKLLATQAGFEIVEGFAYDPRKVCLINDFLAPFSVIGFVLKRTTNRWVILPAVRKLLMLPVAMWGEGLLKGAERDPEGGLVFIAARKPA